jgi:hypothetical protein
LAFPGRKPEGSATMGPKPKTTKTAIEAATLKAFARAAILDPSSELKTHPRETELHASYPISIGLPPRLHFCHAPARISIITTSSFIISATRREEGIAEF